MFENNHEIILLVDPKTGAVVDANFSACKYYGWSRREMLTKKITDIDTSHAPLVYERMHLALKESKNSYILEHRLANGVKKDVGVTMAPLFLKRQSLLYWTVHEIVERKIWDKKADCVAEHNI